MIYYKDLAHIIMEADKFQDLHLANWKSRRVDGVVLVESKALRNARV